MLKESVMLKKAIKSEVPNLENLIPRGKTIETDMLRDRLIKILNSEAEVLPPTSSPLGRLWRLVNSPNSTLEECGETIKLDPALTTRVFRVANSAANAGHNNQRATSLDAALMRIGLSQLRELVFNSGVLAQFSSRALPKGWERFWLRNILVARTAERLASLYFRTNGTEYLAGLLHDSGISFLAEFFTEEFNKIFDGSCAYLENETLVFPASHAAVSAAVCARSLLPMRVVNAVIYHHHPMLLEGQTVKTAGQSSQFLGVILFLADRGADLSGFSVGDDPMTFEEINETKEAKWLSNFGPVHLEELIAEELPKAEETFSIFWS